MNKEGSPQIEDNQEIVRLLKRMLVKFEAMEEKMDSLLKQSKERSFKNKQFSSSRKEYGGDNRAGIVKHAARKEAASSEGKFYHGQPFGKKKSASKRNFKGKRKYAS